MHDAHASMTAGDTGADESHELVPCFVPGKAMQVEIVLHHPAAAAQIAQDAARKTVAVPCGFVATFQKQVQQGRAVQGFVQRRGFVKLTLARDRRWQRWFVMNPVEA